VNRALGALISLGVIAASASLALDAALGRHYSTPASFGSATTPTALEWQQQQQQQQRRDQQQRRRRRINAARYALALFSAAFAANLAAAPLDDALSRGAVAATASSASPFAAPWGGSQGAAPLRAWHALNAVRLGGVLAAWACACRQAAAAV
jgi:hypothetical protein